MAKKSRNSTAKTSKPIQAVSNDAARKKGTYPYYSLKTSLELGKVVRDAGGERIGVPKSVVAHGVKMSLNSSSFAQLVASTKCFGIVEGHTELQLSDLGRDYFMPTTDSASRLAELEFLNQPPTFASLIAKFDGSILPNAVNISHILTREFRIPGSWSTRVAQLFVGIATDLGVLDPGNCLRYSAVKHVVSNNLGTGATNVISNPALVHQIPLASQLGSHSHTQTTLPAPIKVGATTTTWVKGEIRLETPDNMSYQMWELLKNYVQILEPSRTDTE